MVKCNNKVCKSKKNVAKSIDMVLHYIYNRDKVNAFRNRR